MTDIRVYLAGGKEKSSEKNNTEKVHKRPIEEGKVPQSKRKFLPSWKTDFPWVYHRDGAMFCSVCEDRPNLSDSSSAFVSGSCVNFRLDSLRSHAGSVGHQRAADAFRIAANPREAVIPWALRRLNKEVALKLEKRFDIAYFVAKMEMSFTTYPHLCLLEEKHAVELGQTYRNDKACKDFIVAISDQFKNEIGEQLQRAQFLGVMADSATDVGVREVEDVYMYVRYLKDGEPVNTFVGLRPCPNAKAPGITEAVNSAMRDVCDNWKEKAVTLGTDGAAVMVGEVGGVFALLKRDIPHLIKVHCIAHRLELAFADTVKAIPELVEAKTMLQGIWKHYHYSPKAVRELKELAESMQVRAYKAVKADGTRWVPHLKRALDVLLSKNYYAVVSHLQHTSQARDASITMQGRSSNYCKKLVNYKFLLFLHLLLDIHVVTAISKLSLQFQEDKMSISQLQDKVNALSSMLDSFKVRAGEYLNSFQEEVSDGNLYKGLELTRSERDTASFASSKDEIINKATAFITERFRGLGGTSILTDHKSWPLNNRQQLFFYGEDAIQVLSHHFEALLDQHHFNLQSCRDEWMEIKVHLQRERTELQYSTIEFWKGKFQVRERFPNFLLVIEICLVIPVQTACCERGNSCLNRIMCDFRSTLGVSTVETLMRISINGVSPEHYHSALAVARWLDSGERAR
ncbi:zinc finger protein 862-like [Montipora capricornis]|uniref:zinc finger protein 862-like n=1 Tax=Montipora capricornis TaxID=246305 RepID=UPI0035F10AF9